jgi:hypothetical protein
LRHKLAERINNRFVGNTLLMVTINKGIRFKLMMSGAQVAECLCDSRRFVDALLFLSRAK